MTVVEFCQWVVRLRFAASSEATDRRQLREGVERA